MSILILRFMVLLLWKYANVAAVIVDNCPISVGEERASCVHIYAVPEAGVFKTSRFNVGRNNVRAAWFAGSEEGLEAAGMSLTLI